jgi:hypothetical protein
MQRLPFFMLQNPVADRFFNSSIMESFLRVAHSMLDNQDSIRIKMLAQESSVN